MARNSPSTTRNPNRSDLAAPVTAAPNQPYGIAAQQIAAQGVVPMGPQPIAGGGQAGPPSAPSDPNAMVAALQAHAAAGGGPHPQGFTRPTERPNEPVTHGLPIGPGAGPEALTGIGGITRDNMMGQATLGQLLSQLASQPGAPSAVQDLATRASAGIQ